MHGGGGVWNSGGPPGRRPLRVQMWGRLEGELPAGQERPPWGVSRPRSGVYVYEPGFGEDATDFLLCVILSLRSRRENPFLLLPKAARRGTPQGYGLPRR